MCAVAETPPYLLTPLTCFLLASPACLMIVSCLLHAWFMLAIPGCFHAGSPACSSACSRVSAETARLGVTGLKGVTVTVGRVLDWFWIWLTNAFRIEKGEVFCDWCPEVNWISTQFKTGFELVQHEPGHVKQRENSSALKKHAKLHLKVRSVPNRVRTKF